MKQSEEYMDRWEGGSNLRGTDECPVCGRSYPHTGSAHIEDINDVKRMAHWLKIRGAERLKARILGVCDGYLAAFSSGERQREAATSEGATPDSREWWKEVAQKTSFQLNQANAEILRERAISDNCRLDASRNGDEIATLRARLAEVERERDKMEARLRGIMGTQFDAYMAAEARVGELEKEIRNLLVKPGYVTHVHDQDCTQENCALYRVRAALEDKR